MPSPISPISHRIFKLTLFFLRFALKLDSNLRLFFSHHRINLAYQELYLVLAAIFRVFNDEEGGPRLELYETTRERDIDMDADFGGPKPQAGSLGLRVKVVG